MGSMSCAKCPKIKQQAEEAFAELRVQTDKHIAAFQRKLTEEFSEQINKLKAENAALQAEVVVLRPPTGQTRKTLEEKLRIVEKESSAKISKLAAELDCAIAQSRNEREEAANNHAREKAMIESKANALETANADLQRQIALIEDQLTRTKSDYRHELDRQARTVAAERDDAVNVAKRLQARTAELETAKRESDLERARMDLAYRKRVGEMESEVRRTEIESVRLRREIIQLNQRIESLDSASSHRPLQLTSGRRTTLFALESGSGSVGRIARLSTPPTLANSSDDEPQVLSSSIKFLHKQEQHVEEIQPTSPTFN